jgi:hypothetical protein
MNMRLTNKQQTNKEKTNDVITVNTYVAVIRRDNFSPIPVFGLFYLLYYLLVEIIREPGISDLTLKATNSFYSKYTVKMVRLPPISLVVTYLQ